VTLGFIIVATGVEVAEQCTETSGTERGFAVRIWALISRIASHRRGLVLVGIRIAGLMLEARHPPLR